MRHWSRIERILLAAFLFWFACGLIFTVGRIGPVTVDGWPLPWRLKSFVSLCVQTGDPLLILLAFSNTHLLAARQWGAAAARRWALLVVLLSLVVETLGAATGFPFGVYAYTDRFGPVIGLVPLVIPLAWHVVLTNSLLLVRGAAPHLSRWVEAMAAGFLASLYDAVLEPFATVVKGYWHWCGGSVPVQNYLAWFILATLLMRALAPTVGSRTHDVRPLIILGATVVLFLAGRGVL